jgi:hypothetical protein
LAFQNRMLPQKLIVSKIILKKNLSNLKSK